MSKRKIRGAFLLALLVLVAVPLADASSEIVFRSI